MSTHRYRSAGPTAAQITDFVPGATIVGSIGGFVEYDVALTDDANLADLNVFMASMGFVFVSTSPSTPRELQATILRLPTQADQVSLAGQALLTFDGTTIRKSVSTGAVRDLITGSIVIPIEAFSTPAGSSATLNEWQSAPAQQEDAWGFTPTNNDTIYYNMPVPADWGSGGFTVQIAYAVNAVIPGGAQVVRWQLGEKILAEGVSHAVNFNTLADVDIDLNTGPVNGVQNAHGLVSLGTSATPSDINNSVTLGIRRIGSPAPADNFAGNAFVIGVKVSYRVA